MQLEKCLIKFMVIRVLTWVTQVTLKNKVAQYLLHHNYLNTRILTWALPIENEAKIKILLSEVNITVTSQTRTALQSIKNS